MRHPLHSTRVRIRAPRHGGATASNTMESLHQHQGQKILGRVQTLEKRASQTKTREPWRAEKTKSRIISGKAFGSHHSSSDVRKRRLEHFRPNGTTRRPNQQPTLDGGSPTQRSVVSFPLCRPTPALQPFYFKRREPFSRHQRSHHLFWQVLRFPLPWFIM